MSGTGFVIAAYLGAAALYGGYLWTLLRRERDLEARIAVAEVGRLALMIALAVAGFAVLSGLVGAMGHRRGPTRNAEWAMVAAAVAITTASVALFTALLTRDFGLAYVAQYTSRSLSTFYTLGAFWAGQAGSLLLWAWVLSLCGALVVAQRRRHLPALMPWVVTVLAGILLFFLVLVAFYADPFARLAVAPPDGQGLNPLLQNYGQWIHPLTLYLGYVGFSVPFAFAIAALITGELDDRWLLDVRRWTLWSWILLSAGILLGARWAYVELGWGGYWAWDPVENVEPASVAHRDDLPPLGGGAGTAGRHEDVERRAPARDVRAVHLRHVPHPIRGRVVRSCVRRVDDGADAPRVHRPRRGGVDRADRVATAGPGCARSLRVRGLARVVVPRDRPRLHGDDGRGVLGHGVPTRGAGRPGYEGLGGAAVLRLVHGAPVDRAVGLRRDLSAAGLAAHRRRAPVAWDCVAARGRRRGAGARLDRLGRVTCGSLVVVTALAAFALTTMVGEVARGLRARRRIHGERWPAASTTCSA